MAMKCHAMGCPGMAPDAPGSFLCPDHGRMVSPQTWDVVWKGWTFGEESVAWAMARVLAVAEVAWQSGHMKEQQVQPFMEGAARKISDKSGPLADPEWDFIRASFPKPVADWFDIPF